jgi:hypothetical protein
MMAAVIALAVQNLLLLGVLVWFIQSEQRMRERASTRWTEVLNELSAGYSEQLKTIANLRVTGAPGGAVATVLPREPDAEDRLVERVGRETNEAAARRGAQKIMEHYRSKGLGISEEEAMVQAESMLAGRIPSP